MQHNNLIIRNVNIATPGNVILSGSLVIEDGLIKDISQRSATGNTNYPTIDAQGNYLVPGIIDLHTDAMDLEICPRASADFPIYIAFRELERRMCGCGYTTTYHSIHLGSRMYESTLRSKYSRMNVFEGVHNACQKSSLIKNKIHLRYEITGVEEYQQCIELINKGYIHLFSFMDHTPKPELLSDGEKLVKFAKRKRMTEEMARIYVENELKRPKISKDQIIELIKLLKSKNISIASHDDDSVKQVEENHAMGIELCEFPLNFETAQKATDLGMPVIGGSSNILRGGSSLGNMSVEEGISKKIINVLCSDYYPPSILHSVFQLFNKNIVTLPEAVNLVSLNPAKAANIGISTGSIEIGKEADLLIVSNLNKFTTLLYTIVKGNISGEYNLKQTKIYETSMLR